MYVATSKKPGSAPRQASSPTIADVAAAIEAGLYTVGLVGGVETMHVRPPHGMGRQPHPPPGGAAPGRPW